MNPNNEGRGSAQEAAAAAQHDGEWGHKRRAFNEKVINRIARDPRFRRALLDDPEAALHAAGLHCELLELQALDVEAMPDVVARKCTPLSCVTTCTLTCRSNTCTNTITC